MPFTRHCRAGFTLVELILTVSILGLLMLISIPRIGTILSHSRVNRSASVVAVDLERAFALAGRQRKPVRLTCICDSVGYRVTDRTGGTVRLTRMLGANDEGGVTAIAFSATPIDIFPSGVASSPLTVTISAGGYTRQVTMTTAGLVRIVPQ